MTDSSLAAILGFIAVIAAAILTSRQQGTRDLISGLTDKVEDQADEITNQGHRIAVLEHRDRLLVDYAWQLRQHILDEKDPPPPAWPEGLDC